MFTDIYSITNNVDKPLELALLKLAKRIIDDGTVNIDIDELDRQILLDNHLIDTSEYNHKILVCDFLIFYILKELENRGEFSFSNEVDEWSKAEKKLRKIDGSYPLIVEYHCFAIRYIDAIYPESLLTCILSDKMNLWEWVMAINKTIEILLITPRVLYELAKEIISTHHNDFAIGQLYGSISQFCQNDYGKGLKMLNLSIDNLDYPLNNITIGCIRGLLGNDYERAKAKLFTLLENEALREVIIFAYSEALNICPENCKEWYDKVSSFSDFRGKTALQFYWEVYKLKNELNKQCENKLIEIITEPTEDILDTAIGKLFFVENITYFERRYIDIIITSPNFSIDHIACLDRNISSICDTTMLISIIREIANRFGLKFNPEMFHNSICKMVKNKPEEFTLSVIALITDNNGIIRHIGRKIWASCKLNNSDIDVNSLTQEIQLRFIISILQDSGNPQDRLKKVLPLFDSQYTLAPKLLLKQLVPYINNYMGAVIEELDSLSINNKEEVSQLREYFKARCAFIDKRVACKEFNPLYTQCKVLNEFKRAYQEYMRGITEEVEKNHKSPFLDLCTTVQLAKGGGFRDENGKVQGLARILHSMSFPVMIPSMSEVEEIEMNNKIFANWDNVTDLWKVL